MKNNNHYYKNNLRRMFLFYAIIPVLLLSFICLFMFWGAWRFSLEETNKKNNLRISTNLENTIKAYMKEAELFAVQENILDVNLDTNARVKIFQSIYGIANRLGKKANLYVFDQELNPVISGTKMIPSFLDGNYYVNWGIFRQMNQKPAEIALKIVENENTENMQLLIGKAILQGKECIGYVVFALDSKEYRIEIAELESQTIITDEFGWVFSTNHFSFLDNMNRFIFNRNEKNGYFDNIFGKHYITSNSILDGRINIYSISSFHNQVSIFQFIVVILFLVFFMMIIAVFISTKHMAIKKTKDIYAIIDAFEKVKEGDLNIHIDISSNDEFEIIGESYNRMLDSLKEQIESNKEMGRLVVTSQTKQLESQFNPHFLYNTLENIRYMCKLDPLSASKMIFNLSTLLRYSISNVQEEVTVKEDVIYTENYLSILKYRFNQRFQYQIRISKDIEQCIIPKLIIQPMLENSIKYGFEGKDSLTVEIIGCIENDKLVLTCIDDGCGMRPEILEETRYNLLQHRNKSNHSGLFNIHRRIQLKYGDEYGIHIQSELGLGTILKVELPINYGNVGETDNA